MASELTLEALRKLIDAAKGIGKSLGIDKLSVEGRGRIVDSDAVTDADAKSIGSAGDA